MNLLKRILILMLIFILTLSVSGMCEVSGTMLPILLYHNVTDFYDPLNKGDNISPRVLESHFKMLKDFGFNTISFDQYFDYRTNGTPLPENPIIISFDDGYLSNYLIAYPMLKKYGFKATIFTVTKASYDSSYCNYRHFSWEQAKEMQESGFIDIQSHSYSHFIHTDKTEEDNEKEIKTSHFDITKNTGKSPTVYAYPSGKFTENTQKKAEEAGYRIQVIVRGGVNDDNTPLNELTRLNIDGDMSASDLINLIIKYKQNLKGGI